MWACSDTEESTIQLWSYSNVSNMYQLRSWAYKAVGHGSHKNVTAKDGIRQQAGQGLHIPDVRDGSPPSPQEEVLALGDSDGPVGTNLKMLPPLSSLRYFPATPLCRNCKDEPMYNRQSTLLFAVRISHMRKGGRLILIKRAHCKRLASAANRVVLTRPSALNRSMFSAMAASGK